MSAHEIEKLKGGIAREETRLTETENKRTANIMGRQVSTFKMGTGPERDWQFVHQFAREVYSCLAG